MSASKNLSIEAERRLRQNAPHGEWVLLSFWETNSGFEEEEEEEETKLCSVLGFLNFFPYEIVYLKVSVPASPSVYYYI